MNLKMLKATVAGLVLSVSCFANAGLIIQADSVTTNMGEYSATYLANDAIDQSGLSIGYTSGVSDFDTYLSLNPTHIADSNTWFSSVGVSSGYFDLSLGGMFNISSLALWNESQTSGQGVNTFNLYAANNIDFNASTLLGSFAAIEGTQTAQVFNFSNTLASHFRIEVLSNHGSSCCTGIMEIAFEKSVTDVPEPSTLAILALGVMGLTSRRFKKQA
ncbi:PEP-CTERM sorting domain-containing protein [Colwelliaceae bacterium MEBiC 14330]